MLELNKIHCGDNLELLKQLDNESVNCQICSPPYFNLRDYGTAQWVGGDENCDHVIKLGGNGELSKKQVSNTGTQLYQYRDECGKCGATRDDKQFGLEPTPEDFVNKLCDIFDDVYRVLKPDGTCFVNLGDSYLGSGKGVQKGRDKAKKESFQFIEKPKEILGGWRKSKQLAMIPARFAIEMQNRGWILRNEIIWHKPNQLPASVKDRFTVDFEKIYFFVKSPKYYFNQQFEPLLEESKRRAMRGNSSNNKYAKDNHLPDGVHPNTMSQPREFKGYENMDDIIARGETPLNAKGRNKRCVWSINTKPLKEAHFAVYPTQLVEPCILAGCPENGVVLDIFSGAGTTALVAAKLNRQFLGFELNQSYIDISNKRLSDIQMEFKF